MKRSPVPPSALLQRVLVVAALVLVLLGSYKWGQYARLLQITKSFHDASLSGVLNSVTQGASNGTAVRNASEPWVELVSWSPRVFVYHNFMPHSDCDHIVEMGTNYVTRSEVVGVTGKSLQHDARSSSGVFLTGSLGADDAVMRLQRRIAEWTQIPENHGEVFYLIRYEVGQQYKPHYDFFSNDENGKPFIGSSGNRMATVLTYLSTPDEGGETIFPEASLFVKAAKGDSVLFFNMHPDGSTDPRSLHGGKPVIRGTKWAMTRWIREKPF